MNTKRPNSEEQLGLPNIQLIESSEQAFGDAFLRATRILYRHFERIKSAIAVIKDFTKEPFNLAIVGLFSKMCRHYYSCVLLEINHDRIGSQFLIEHLCEAAITLTYLLEEVDESLFSEYIFASAYQTRYLLIEVEEQLHNFPNHPDLLILKDKLETCIAQQQEYAAERPLIANSEPYLWGPQEANTTANRAVVIGLNFLTNPARKIALKVKPASWLELQLDYLNSLTKSSSSKAQPGINFTYLRDASHLCLHATQAFLEEVVNYQNIKLPDIEDQQQILNLLYVWFHNAHHVYQLRCCAKTQERDDPDYR